MLSSPIIHKIGYIYVTPSKEVHFMRISTDGRIWYHEPGVQKRYFKADHKNYRYFDLESNSHKRAPLEWLEQQIRALPDECQQILLDNSLTNAPLTYDEQHKLLLLCSLSISVWGGSPKGEMPYESMSDYSNEFYINMVRLLTAKGKSRWDSKKSLWTIYVRYIRLATMCSLAKKWNKMKPLLISFASMPDLIMNTSDEGWDRVEAELDKALLV
jgi:hypothetical protein